MALAAVVPPPKRDLGAVEAAGALVEAGEAVEEPKSPPAGGGCKVLAPLSQKKGYCQPKNKENLV
jgi:hypothetical protein